MAVKTLKFRDVSQIICYCVHFQRSVRSTLRQ